MALAGAHAHAARLEAKLADALTPPPPPPPAEAIAAALVVLRAAIPALLVLLSLIHI